MHLLCWLLVEKLRFFALPILLNPVGWVCLQTWSEFQYTFTNDVWGAGFKFCWSLEAFCLPVDRHYRCDCAFQSSMFPMNSRFRDHYKKTGLLCTEAGKCKRAQQKLEDRRISRTDHFSRQRNLSGLSGDSETLSKWRHFLLLGKIIAIIRLNLNNICSELLLDYYYLSSSCSGRIRFDSCSLYPQNEIGPSISSSVVLCVFVLLVYIVVLV